MESITDGPSIDDHEVHVRFARLAPDPEADRRAWAVLTPGERDRALRFVKPRDRSLQIRNRAAVRRVLAVYLQVVTQDVDIVSGPKGKPELAGGPSAGRPRFNVSHSGSAVIMAVSMNHQVGVDIEEVRTDVDRYDIARNLFSLTERGAIANLPRAAQQRAFFDCWVRKEAYLKGLGVGLQRSTTNFSVPVIGNHGPVEDSEITSGGGGGPPGWHVYGLDIEEGLAASVAADGQVVVKLQQWESQVAP
jgi:4'-phosphopantetheinyl transferase